MLYAGLLLLIAGAAAFYLNPESLVVLFIAAATITIYSIFAKRNTFLSFLPVGGISYGLVPIGGVWLAFDPAGILKGSDGVILPLPAICFGLMMCVTDWAFTLGGVARDVEGGDRLKGAPTMPVTFGIPLYRQICDLLVDCRGGYCLGYHRRVSTSGPGIFCRSPCFRTLDARSVH